MCNSVWPFTPDLALIQGSIPPIPNNLTVPNLFKYYARMYKLISHLLISEMKLNYLWMHTIPLGGSSSSGSRQKKGATRV